MGYPPVRIEVATGISGVNFDECYAERVTDTLDGIEVNIISLRHLKLNKRASGRHKDLADLDNLPCAFREATEPFAAVDAAAPHSNWLFLFVGVWVGNRSGLLSPHR